MILHALIQYYNALAARGKIAQPGWCDAKVSYALNLDENGELLGVFSLKVPTPDGKKELPQIIKVPEQEKRTVGVKANFLCDNSSYLLGIDSKGKPARSLECFEAAAALHQAILSAVDSPAARAILGFFTRWNPAKAVAHPALADTLEEILKDSNLIFRLNGVYAQDDPALRAAWARYRGARDVPQGRCLVTGERAPIAVLHPSIKGVQGAQSSGASLVSFNAPAFESFGHELADNTGQGYNAPVSEQAAFAYGTALNHLLSDREHVQRIGDTTIVYWAEDGEPLYQDTFSFCTFGTHSNRITQNDLSRIIHALANGQPVDVDAVHLNPENHFYVLGLAPSAARLSIRFFLQDSFGDFIKNNVAHYKRLQIYTPPYEKKPFLPVYALLNETVNQNSKDKKPSPSMASALFRAILQNTKYPYSLYSNILLRINAEQDVTWKKAAIIKAFILKNYPDDTRLKEELTTPIRYEEEEHAFILGCLLALLEKIQQEAIENINQTIVDKYLSTACATPAQVFDDLLKNSRYHLHKVHNKYRRAQDLEQLLSCYHALKPAFPEHLNHTERGNFMVGYYLKRQELWLSKDALKEMEEQSHV